MTGRPATPGRESERRARSHGRRARRKKARKVHKVILSVCLGLIALVCGLMYALYLNDTRPGLPPVAP